MIQKKKLGDVLTSQYIKGKVPEMLTRYEFQTRGKGYYRIIRMKRASSFMSAIISLATYTNQPAAMVAIMAKDGGVRANLLCGEETHNDFSPKIYYRNDGDYIDFFVTAPFSAFVSPAISYTMLVKQSETQCFKDDYRENIPEDCILLFG